MNRELVRRNKSDFALPLLYTSLFTLFTAASLLPDLPDERTADLS
jgi:hypothetical protein